MTWSLHKTPEMIDKRQQEEARQRSEAYRARQAPHDEVALVNAELNRQATTESHEWQEMLERAEEANREMGLAGS